MEESMVQKEFREQQQKFNEEAVKVLSEIHKTLQALTEAGYIIKTRLEEIEKRLTILEVYNVPKHIPDYKPES